MACPAGRNHFIPTERSSTHNLFSLLLLEKLFLYQHYTVLKEIREVILR